VEGKAAPADGRIDRMCYYHARSREMNRHSPQFEYMSLDDFEELLADKPADERWELIGGRVVRMMVGARWEHNFIIQNLSSGIRERLRAMSSPCRTLVETFRLKTVPLQSSMLPDIIVRCRALEPGAASLDDPTVLIEILSEGTKARDRLEKWHVYQKLPSLMHYVLVERDRAYIEVFDRVGATWSGVRILEGLDAALELPEIKVSVPFAEIYQDVLSK
jgi:Uma2 family endonuclease